MYSVMLIDDYVPTLKYLERLVSWEQLGMKVAAKYHSSLKALEEFPTVRPDILITDIGMPQMDGIELAARCKEIKPDLRVVFLTCHEEFHYAKRAIELHADDYIIKDELSTARLCESLNKTISSLRSQDAYQSQRSYQEDVLRNRDVLKQSLLQRLLEGHEGTEEMIKFGRRLGIRSEFPYFALCSGRIDLSSFISRYGSDDMHLIEYGLYNIAQEIADKWKARNDHIEISTFLTNGMQAGHEACTLLTMINFKKRLQMNIYDAIREYANEVKQRAWDYLRVQTQFICSREFTGLQQLRKVYVSLKKSEKYMYYHEAAIEFAETDAVTRWNESEAELLARTTDELLVLLKKKRLAAAAELFNQTADLAKSKRIDPAQWLSSCSRWIRLIHTETNMQLPEYMYGYLQQSRRWSETVRLMERQLALAAGAVTLPKPPAKEPKLQLIDQYIIDNLSENITTISMARYLYLNPNYFSRYFKKITGDNFIDYVHRFKMEIAVKLLQNKFESVESIALKLGYTDRTYFSRVFKKVMDISPSDYRERHGS